MCCFIATTTKWMIECTWISPLSLSSHLKYITITLTGLYLGLFLKDLIYIYIYIYIYLYLYIYIYMYIYIYIYILLTYLFALLTICSTRWRKFCISTIWVFLIKQHFQYIENYKETIELQKKQKSTDAKKLILNSSHDFNP